MNALEDKLRAALDERAEQTGVDTTRLWHATDRRIHARQTKRSSRVRWLVPAIGVGALTAAGAVAVPAWLSSPTSHTAQLTPAATRTATATPSTKPSWQYGFHDAPPNVVKDVARHEGLDPDEVVPVDYVNAPDGTWLLFATNQPPGTGRPRPDRYTGMGWMNLKVDDLVGGGGFGKAGVPTSDPLGGPVNKWLTSSHLLDYPHYGGDGLVSPTGLQFAAGQARNEVARVTGVDTQGREHEAKLVGKEQGWPTQQYFIVVREPIQLKTYKAYDAHGKLLGSVTSEDFWDWPDN